MKIRLMVLAGFALLVSGSASARTVGFSTAVTGATDPTTTGVVVSIPANFIFEVIGVIPVVNTVTGAPASMAANVNVGTFSAFNACGSGTPTCSNDMWAAQWTIVSAPTGIQAVNAYQGTSVKLVNSGSATNVILRCQVGQMTGSCIFVMRAQPIADPLF